MAANKSKPRGVKLGTSVSNLLASMPWLKNKTFLIPAIASVLVLSTVGVVSAVQGGVFGPSNQESAEVTIDESESEAAEQPAIGFACVEGTKICEEVKDILLETDYEEVLRTWTRSTLIDYFAGRHGRSRVFVTEVIDAVRFDWGDGSTFAGSGGSSGSDSGSSPGSGSVSSSIPCSGSASICSFLREIYALGQFDEFIKEDLVSYIVRTYKVTQASAEATVDSTGYNWGDRGLPELERAARNLTSDSYTMSRIQVAEYMRDYIGLGYSESLAAIDALGVDWNLKAKKQGESILSQGPFSPERIRGALRAMYFEDSEAEAGVAALGIDEFAQASLMARDFLERQTPPCEFSYDQAFEYMTQKEYFEYEPASYGLLEYLELDENNNDVWLICGR